MHSDQACLLTAILVCHSQCLAHSGITFIAHALNSEIKVDGDLSDWPNSTVYELSVPYIFDGKPDTDDYTGRFRVGCDYERGVLYIGVEIKDDVIKLDSPVDMWNSRDACEIFLTLKHAREASVPLQFVYRKEPLVAEADQFSRELNDTFLAARKHDGKRLTYEWRIDLKSLPDGDGITEKPTVVGFDVGYVDLDEDGDIAVFSSSPGRAKHLSSATLGDLIMHPKVDALVNVTGQVTFPEAPPESEEAEEPSFPPVALQSSEPSDFYVQVPCDKSGRYCAQLPPATYVASLVDSLSARVSEDERVTLEVEARKQRITVPTLKIRSIEKPELIEETGLLLREDFNAEQVDRFVNAYMKYHRVPGLSLAIVKEGEIVYGKGFGVKSLANNDPVTDSTLFEVASMTKPMFAFAVCRLVERGVLELDTPLWKYLPYADIEHDERYKKITARMVLCHRAGFPNWRDGDLKIHFEPGTKQMYSGEAFGYLAKVVSHLTGKKIGTLMNEEVFAPLAIENTYLTWDGDADDSLVAMPHNEHNTTLVKSQWDDVWVAGCLHVDARNFAKFLRAVINKQGLSAESYAEMLRPQVEIPAGSDEQNFSLGFVVGNSEFGKHCRHGGHNTGFTSAFKAYLDRKCAYVFMVNNYQAAKFEKDLEAFLLTGTVVE